MKKLVAIACLMLAVTPATFGQDKGKDDAVKAAPAKVEAPKADKAADKSGDKAEKPKKERTAAQKANDAHLKECNTQAGGKKDKERDEFMRSCMKEQRKASNDKRKAQQEKFGACSKEAKSKNLKGDERKAFMKECASAK